MVRLGIKHDACDALRSAAIVLARIAKRDHRLGMIEAGKDADLIVTGGNPFANFNALELVDMNFIAGREMIEVSG